MGRGLRKPTIARQGIAQQYPEREGQQYFESAAQTGRPHCCCGGICARIVIRLDL